MPILLKCLEHLELLVITLFIALCLALPLGIALAHTRFKTLSASIIRFLGLIQTIPGLALIALIIAFLAALRAIVPLPATGFLPAIIVLVCYALLPLVSSTYTGIKGVAPSTFEVAKGMGMTKWQILFHVELPLALSVIMHGVRLSFVWTIGMITLTSLVGSGGLGDLILQGLRTMQVDLVLKGTLPAALMALMFDHLMSRCEKWLLPT